MFVVFVEVWLVVTKQTDFKQQSSFVNMPGRRRHNKQYTKPEEENEDQEQAQQEDRPNETEESNQVSDYLKQSNVSQQRQQSEEDEIEDEHQQSASSASSSVGRNWIVEHCNIDKISVHSMSFSIK